MTMELTPSNVQVIITALTAFASLAGAVAGSAVTYALGRRKASAEADASLSGSALDWAKHFEGSLESERQARREVEAALEQERAERMALLADVRKLHQRIEKLEGALRRAGLDPTKVNGDD